MAQIVHRIRSTQPLRHVVIARAVAGLPLLGIGLMHVTGAAPMRPILEAAQIPLPGLNAMLAPILEVLAGIMIVLGAFARIGALIAAGAMAVALYAHSVADWPDEPPIILPIAVLASALYVLYRGAGRWSVDAHKRGEDGMG